MSEPALPIDPDVDADQTPAGAPRPVHLRASSLAIVFAGGAVGTLAREALSVAFPPVDGVSYTTLAINVAGAFLLGVLLETLARRGPDHGHRRTLRLLLGTGVMGGFTTYSALATDTARLLRDGAVAPALLYALGTVVVGAAATWAGIAAGGGIHRRVRRERA